MLPAHMPAFDTETLPIVSRPAFSARLPYLVHLPGFAARPAFRITANAAADRLSRGKALQPVMPKRRARYVAECDR